MATGHIRKRTSKTGSSWQLVVESDRDPITGKRERIYRTSKGTKKQAEAELRNLIFEVENGGTLNTSAIKVKDWLQEYLQLYLPHISDLTRESYEERITNKIDPYLGNIQLKTLSTAHVQSWVNELNKTLSPKSVVNLFNILRPALEKAVVLQMIPRNPCVGVVKPKLTKQHGDVYDTSEIKAALDVARGTTMYPTLLLELSTGMRRGETLALTWNDVNFQTGEITISKSAYVYKGERKIKTPKTIAGIRTVTVGKNILDELLVMHNEYATNKEKMGVLFTDSNLVICQENGKPYHPDSMTTKWRRFVKDNNLKQIRFHDLRHTNATTMIESGVDVKTVQTRLGHSDISTTLNIYTHRTKAMDTNAAQKIDDVIYS